MERKEVLPTMNEGAMPFFEINPIRGTTQSVVLPRPSSNTAG